MTRCAELAPLISAQFKQAKCICIRANLAAAAQNTRVLSLSIFPEQMIGKHKKHEAIA